MKIGPFGVSDKVATNAESKGSCMELFEYKGYAIPVRLVNLTGGGPDTFDPISIRHMEQLRRYIPIAPDHHVLEIGCGIGRDAIPLTEILSERGRYLGVDIIGDSIAWCQEHITPRHPHFRFVHFDVKSQVHNPGGTLRTQDMRLPLENGTVDRIILQSVFTHNFEPDIVHLMGEFRRVLAPSGLVMATFFLVDDEILKGIHPVGARRTPAYAFLTFRHRRGNGCYITDPQFPEGAVAYTLKAVARMLSRSGLELAPPVHFGAWSERYKEAPDAQDVLVLRKGRQPAKRVLAVLRRSVSSLWTQAKARIYRESVAAPPSCRIGPTRVTGRLREPHPGAGGWKSVPMDTDLRQFEFDQYQRYTFLRKAFAIAFERNPAGSGAGPVTVLDVGSGPENLTATFLGPSYRVTRSDIESHGQSDMIVLQPGRPLEVSDGAFDAVVLLEVLEHVPPGERLALIRECLRAARHLVVITCPTGSPEVAAAENRIGEAFAAVTKRAHPFLSQHQLCGLPTVEEMGGYLDVAGFPYVAVDNVRLDHWEAYLLLDNMLRREPGGPELCPRVYRSMNEATPSRFRQATHYRKVYVVAKDRSLAASLRTLADDSDVPSAEGDCQQALAQLAQFCAKTMAALHGEVRSADAQIAAMTQEIAQLRRSLRNRVWLFCRRLLRGSGNP